MNCKQWIDIVCCVSGFVYTGAKHITVVYMLIDSSHIQTSSVYPLFLLGGINNYGGLLLEADS